MTMLIQSTSHEHTDSKHESWPLKCTNHDLNPKHDHNDLLILSINQNHDLNPHHDLNPNNDHANLKVPSLYDIHHNTLEEYPMRYIPYAMLDVPPLYARIPPKFRVRVGVRVRDSV